MRKLMAWLKRISLENKLAFIGIVVTIAIAMVSATWAVVTRVIDKREKQLPEQTTQSVQTMVAQTESFDLDVHNSSLFDIIPIQFDNPSLNYTRGEAYLEQGKYEEALNCFALAAREYDPNSLECACTLFQMGKAYSLLEKGDMAHKYFIEAQAINSNLSEPNNQLSAALYCGFGIIYVAQENQIGRAHV